MIHLVFYIVHLDKDRLLKNIQYKVKSVLNFLLPHWTIRTHQLMILDTVLLMDVAAALIVVMETVRKEKFNLAVTIFLFSSFSTFCPLCASLCFSHGYVLIWVKGLQLGAVVSKPHTNIWMKVALHCRIFSLIWLST